MPMAKCMLMAAEGEPRSSLVTVMARNGTDFGIQLASHAGALVHGPGADGARALLPRLHRGRRQPRHRRLRHHRDRRHRRLRHGRGAGHRPVRRRQRRGRARDHPRDGRASPSAANPASPSPRSASPARRPASTCARWRSGTSCPPINTGIAHREPGVGQVGAGLVNPPWECFHAALGRSPNTSAPAAPPRAPDDEGDRHDVRSSCPSPSASAPRPGPPTSRCR